MNNDVMEFLKLIITIVSVSCAFYFGIKTATRNKEIDDKKDATTLAEIATSLTSVKDSLSDIKADVKSVIAENRELRDKLIQVEQSCKSAHHRIDRIEGLSNDAK